MRSVVLTNPTYASGARGPGLPQFTSRSNLRCNMALFRLSPPVWYHSRSPLAPGFHSPRTNLAHLLTHCRRGGMHNDARFHAQIYEQSGYGFIPPLAKTIPIHTRSVHPVIRRSSSHLLSIYTLALSTPLETGTRTSSPPSLPSLIRLSNHTRHGIF